MATPKQIEANRRNAQLSTGPRTAQGKANAHLNALKSGIYSDREVVLPMESPEALTELTSDYYDRFRPTTPEERCLIDSLINDEWLLRRFRRIEGELLTHACKDVEGRSAERFALAKAYMDFARTCERLQRRINATRKAYLKNLEALRDLQAAPEPQPADLEIPAPPELPDPLNQPLAPQIGFVPSNSFSTPIARSPRPAPRPFSCPTRPNRDITTRI